MDNELPYRWLKFGDIKGEIESIIGAAKDKAIRTNYFKNKILKEVIHDKWRLWKQHEEIIAHLTSRCSILGNNVYLTGHNKVGAHINYSESKAPGIETTINVTSQSVCEYDDVTGLCNQEVHTGTQAKYVTWKQKQKACVLIDVAIPAGRSITLKKAANKLKYWSLCIEI